MNTIGINHALASLSKFDQAVAESAKNFGNKFTTQVSNLSNSFAELSQSMKDMFAETTLFATESFSETFVGIDEIAQSSKLFMKEGLGETLAAVKTLTSSMTEMYSETFAGINELSLCNKLLMTENFQGIKEATKETTALIQGSFLACTEALTHDWLDYGFMYTKALGNMHQLSYGKFNGIREFGQTTAENIKLSFSDSFDETLKNLNTLKENMEPALSNIKSTFSTTAEDIKNSFSEAFSEISDSVKAFEKQISVSINNADTIFNKLYKTISMVYGIIFILNKIVKALATSITVLAAKKNLSTAAFIKKGIASAKAAISLTAMKIAATMGVAGPLIAASTIATIGALTGVLRFATGGFPNQGQMFIAREAGPELIGTIGSRNAVVNNDQIVESVSLGVYRAVRDALGGNNGNNNTPLEIKLYLDGKQITSAVERTQRERGLPLLGGGLA